MLVSELDEPLEGVPGLMVAAADLLLLDPDVPATDKQLEQLKRAARRLKVATHDQQWAVQLILAGQHWQQQQQEGEHLDQQGQQPEEEEVVEEEIEDQQQQQKRCRQQQQQQRSQERQDAMEGGRKRVVASDGCDAARGLMLVDRAGRGGSGSGRQKRGRHLNDGMEREGLEQIPEEEEGGALQEARQQQQQQQQKEPACKRQRRLSCSAGDDASEEPLGCSPVVGPSRAGATSRRLSLRSPAAAAGAAAAGDARPRSSGPSSPLERQQQQQDQRLHSNEDHSHPHHQQQQQQQGLQFGSGSKIRWWGPPVPPPSPAAGAAAHTLAAPHRTYYRGFILSQAASQSAVAHPRHLRSPASYSNPSHNNGYSPGMTSSSRGNGSGSSRDDGSGGGSDGLHPGDVLVRLGEGVLLSRLPGEVVSQVVRIEQLWQEVPSDGRPRLLARCRRFYRPQVGTGSKDGVWAEHG